MINGSKSLSFLTHEEIANLIIMMLYKRCGFDDWWNKVDEENKKEIIQEITDILNDEI